MNNIPSSIPSTHQDPARDEGDLIWKAVVRVAQANSESEAHDALRPEDQLFRYRPHRRALAVTLPTPIGPLLVKIYRPKNILDRVLEFFFGKRGTRSWNMGRNFLQKNIPTPEPLFQVVREGWHVVASRLVQDPILLTDDLKGRFLSSDGEGTWIEKRQLLAEVAQLVQRLHKGNFIHGDLTASNLLVGRPPKQKHRLYFIDLDRTKKAPWLAHLFRIADLRLLFLTSWAEISRPQWLRILATYFQGWILSRTMKRFYAWRVLGSKRGRLRLGAQEQVVGGRVPYKKT